MYVSCRRGLRQHPDRADDRSRSRVAGRSPAHQVNGLVASPHAPSEGTFATESTARLSGKLLPELKSMASGLGIQGANKMRKADLVAAIGARQGGGAPAQRSARS